MNITPNQAPWFSLQLIALLCCLSAISYAKPNYTNIKPLRYGVENTDEFIEVNQESQCLENNVFQFELKYHNYEPSNQYFWDFGPNANPGTYEGLLAPTISFTSEGSHTVNLIILDSNGDSISDFSRTVNVIQLEFNIESPSKTDTFCLSTLITMQRHFTAYPFGVPVSYEWFISGDYEIESPLNLSFITGVQFSTIGNQQIILKISAGVDGSVCVKYDTVNIVIIPDLDLDIDVTYQEIDSCYGNQIFQFELENVQSFSDTLNYFWFFGFSAIPASYNGLHPPLVRFTEGGVRQVTFTAFNKGCSQIDTTELTIDPHPFDFTFTRPGCEENQIDFILLGNIQDYHKIIWEFGDGFTSTEVNPSHTYLDDAKNPLVRLTVQLPDSMNCSGRFIKYNRINIWTIRAEILMSADTICITQPLHLAGLVNAGQTDSSRWTIEGDYLNNPNLENTLVENLYFADTGRYLIQYDGYIEHCRYSTSSYVQIAPIPLDQIVVDDTTLCIEDNYFNYSLLNPYPNNYPISHIWDFGENADPETFAGREPPPISYNNTGTHSTSLTYDAYGCKSSDRIQIHVEPLPEFDFNIQQIACPPNSMLFESSGLNNLSHELEWEFGDNTRSNEDSTTHQFTPGEYQATLTVMVSDNEICPGVYTLSHDLVVENYELDLYANDDTLCITQPLYLSGALQNWSTDSSQWTIKAELLDTPNLRTSIIRDVFVKNPGTYYAIYSAFVDSCIYHDSLLFTIVPELTDDLVVDKLVDCFDRQEYNFSIGNPSSIPVVYSWDFGGSNYQGSNPPPIEFPYPDTFQVFLETSSSQCVKYDSISVIVEETPEIDFTYTIYGCDPFNVFFEAIGPEQSVYDILWDFGDGSSSVIPNPNHLFTPGNHTVKLTISLADSLPCAGDYEQIYEVKIDSVFHSIEIDNDTSCIANPMAFNAHLNNWVPDSSRWWFNSPLDGSYNLNQENLNNVYFSMPGTHQGIYYSYIDSCFYSDTISILIYPVPDFILSVNVDSQCISDLNFDFELIGDSYEGDLINWDFGPNAIPSNFNGLKPPKVVYSDSGNYQISVSIDRQGCQTILSKKVYVAAVPIPDFSSNQDGCQPLIVNFKNLSWVPEGSSYYWDFGDGKFSLDKHPVHVYDTAGQFDVSLRIIVPENYPCQDLYEKIEIGYINVNPKPNADFYLNRIVTNLHDPTFNFSSINWLEGSSSFDMGDGTVYRNILGDTLQHFYQYHGIYEITQYITSQHGCMDTLSRQVEVEPVFGLFAPNAFTPNGDGINDNYIQKGVGIGYNSQDYYLEIYNRWGEMIFDTYNQILGWNGITNEGEEAKVDVYHFRVRIIDVIGETHIREGNINLFR